MRENERIVHLDGLRGVAILLVILFHAYARWPEHTPWTNQHRDFPVFKYGWMGVELFFMISGFVIYMTLERCKSFSNFMYRRWIRLFPAMLVVTAILFLSAGFFYERPRGIPRGVDVISGLIFIEPGILNKIFGSHVSNIEGAFWSLYVEMKFYVMFGMIYFPVKNRSIYGLLALAVLGIVSKLLVLLGALRIDGAVGRLMFELFSLNYMGWFCIGALLYMQKKCGGRKYFAVAISLLPFSIFATGGDDMGAFIFGALIFLLFYGALFSGPVGRYFGGRPLVFLGFISYPLYLAHENAMISFAIKVHSAMDWVPGFLTPLPGLCLIVLSSFAIAKYVEPFVRKKVVLLKQSLV